MAISLGVYPIFRQTHLRPPGKMHVGDGAWLGSVALGLALISLRGTKESLTEVVPCSNFTILYHNVSWTWVLPYAAIPNVPTLKNLTSTPPTSISPTESHGRHRIHRISEWWTSGDDFDMAHAFALWSRPEVSQQDWSFGTVDRYIKVWLTVDSLLISMISQGDFKKLQYSIIYDSFNGSS